ncbi:alpha-1,2-fucosyltransferase [Butyrivibrio proteoclasticus]|uniref:alpha-1,2-fucosyltransferase n=1 Tax=Butyrivibrio proteoclasticus TaxID=43305 RepID=UPI00047BD59B|nr:alpha-1,2-fucosyltransferase [Butyrivibrio proteoclasticus]
MQHAVRISDGLGNQMFQYAFAYALQKRTGDNVVIDPFFFKNGLRQYQLDNYNISMKRLVSKGKDYVLGLGPRDGGKFKRIYREHIIKQRFRLVEENNHMHFDEEKVSPCCDSFYLGFWQAAKYFDDYYDEICDEFTRVTPVSGKAQNYIDQVKNEYSVSLHIRRTDYVGDDFDSSLNFEFYRTALSGIESQIGDFNLYIFSDDKEFVKEKFDLMPYTLVEGLSDIDEFEVMRNCKHHIMANSTFSWWATYLAEDKGGIVYAPSVTCWKDEFYVEKWNKLETNLIKSRT